MRGVHAFELEEARHCRSLPGPKAKQLLAEQLVHESSGIYYPRRFPLAPAVARECWIEDVDGNTFLDLTCMAGAVTLGHQPAVMEDFLSCARVLTTTLDFPTEARVKFLNALGTYLTRVLSESVKIHLTGPTGTDAVEAALKLCRFKTGKTTILSFDGSYHGMSVGAAAVSDLPRQAIVPRPRGALFAPFPNCYRCPEGMMRANCSFECLGKVAGILERTRGTDNAIAAAIIEPVQGEGGSIPLPDGYLFELHALLKHYDALLVVDEVQSGFGRAGRLFAFENTSTCP